LINLSFENAKTNHPNKQMDTHSAQRLWVKKHSTERHLADLQYVVSNMAVPTVTLFRLNVCRPNGRVLALTTKHCVGQMSFGRVTLDPKARSPLQTPERLLKVQNTKKLHRITHPGAGNKTLLQP
jgi:hypothetical protein